MKVLIVCSGNFSSTFENSQPFISSQIVSLRNLGIECDLFLIQGKGIINYLKNGLRLHKIIKKSKPNLIHAHYGLSGLLAIMQVKLPVIVSFIGSDIHSLKIRWISRIVMIFSKQNIFVSQSLLNKVKYPPRKTIIIEYGIRLSDFFYVETSEARKRLGLDEVDTYCLFPSSKDRPEKNFSLANYCVSTLRNITILDMGKGYSKEEVNLLYNSCNFVLLTSINEGGPQVIKEAMACNIPIVSTDVGDVRATIGNTEGCYICSYDPIDVMAKINQALEFGKRTQGRARIEEMGIETLELTKKLVEVYLSVPIKGKDI